jgi:hypothetical protein
MIEFQSGDRVLTPYGAGEVVYRRMAPPSYTEVASYSVRLDSKREVVGYEGTIVAAEDCTAKVTPTEYHIP